MFCKKVYLEISQNSQENTCSRVSFSIKLQVFFLLLKKGTLAQVFSREFCVISKNTFSHRTPLVAASERFIRETYVKHIPDFDSLQVSQKSQFQNTLTYHNLFRRNIFAIYFRLKHIVVTVHTFSIRTFSLYQTKVIFAFMKRIDVNHFYLKCVIEY